MSIEFVSVCKSFGPKKILDHVSFVANKGEILFILGKSGVGKSVTLKHIVGLLQPDSGDVRVDGKSVIGLGEDALYQSRLKCGMVFQHPALFDSMTVFENTAFGLKEKERNPKVIIEKLKLVDLNSDILEKFPSEISYGMQKRVSLARTLAPGPDYLLFDEPTTGLDPITTHSINELIAGLSQKLKVTSIVVSHDMNSAIDIADRILVLDQGKIAFLGTTKEILVSTHPLIQDFLSDVKKDLK
jgi:phospholipid/cholesterol/gamma-HCH transport system ATP-binding protein